jgi:hypothetical protein
MPYLHLDLPGTYPVEVKRELAMRLCKLYADVMETQPWRPMSVSPSSASTIFITSVQKASSPLPWSWWSFVAAARQKNGWLWGEQSSTSASSCWECLGGRSWSNSRRIRAKRSSATETGPETGHPPKPLPGEVGVIARVVCVLDGELGALSA